MGSLFGCVFALKFASFPLGGCFMAPVSNAERGVAIDRPAPAPQPNRVDPNVGSSARPAVPARRAFGRNASDDEILGLGSASTNSTNPSLDDQLTFDFDEPAPRETDSKASSGSEDEPENLRAVFEANPELRRDWQEANAYREAFATPEEARAATALLADLDRMDALFFSKRAEDHAELARSIASLDPAAFASLAQAMAAQASQAPDRDGGPSATNGVTSPSASESTLDGHRQRAIVSPQARQEADAATPTPAQANFFQATNAAAVETVIDAIEAQVERLLPDGVSKNARNRVVGEIYRELDGTLRANRQLTQQMREAFRSGSLDADHQRAIISLIAGRARQALPGVAKRVLNEWTSTVVAANQDRRARQRAAERRVDIAGSSGGGREGHRPTSPRDIDYARMSDGDILNL
jgi:hypothetical protein